MLRKQAPVKLSELQEKKRQMRSHDMAELASGANGHSIAERNSVISREDAQRAKIILPKFDPQKLLYTLLDKLDEDTRAHIAIVGGQALFFWSNHYRLSLSSTEDAYLASKDLDFIGTKSEVIKCAEAWGVEYETPDPADPTPNSGLLYIDIDGSDEPLMVDFLEVLQGITDSELKKGLDTAQWEDREYSVRVLTPPLVLKSRLKNLGTLSYGEKEKERERYRIPVAISTTKYYITDRLNAGDRVNRRKAIDWINNILFWNTQPWCIRLCVQYGFEPLEAIPVKHQALGDKFENGHYAIMCDKIMSKRENYAARLTANN